MLAKRTTRLYRAGNITVLLDVRLDSATATQCVPSETIARSDMSSHGPFGGTMVGRRQPARQWLLRNPGQARLGVRYHDLGYCQLSIRFCKGRRSDTRLVERTHLSSCSGRLALGIRERAYTTSKSSSQVDLSRCSMDASSLGERALESEVVCGRAWHRRKPAARISGQFFLGNKLALWSHSARRLSRLGQAINVESTVV